LRSKVDSHKRTNDILLGPLERPALHWLAVHLPTWINPDILTAIGVIGGLVIFGGYFLTNYNPVFLWLVNFGLIINWFGDSMDGTLARFRNIQRPRYGFFIDHSVDAVIEVLIVLGLGLSPYVRFDLATLALIAYLLLSVMVYIQQIVTNEFRISYGRLGPTEVRVGIFLANTFIFFIGNPLINFSAFSISLYNFIVVIATIIMTMIFIYNTISKGRELSRLDNLARDASKKAEPSGEVKPA
jgi:archaetidylinositol phosphate synthase